MTAWLPSTSTSTVTFSLAPVEFLSIIRFSLHPARARLQLPRFSTRFILLLHHHPDCCCCCCCCYCCWCWSLLILRSRATAAAACRCRQALLHSTTSRRTPSRSVSPTLHTTRVLSCCWCAALQNLLVCVYIVRGGFGASSCVCVCVCLCAGGVLCHLIAHSAGRVFAGEIPLGHRVNRVTAPASRPPYSTCQFCRLSYAAT